MMTLTTLVEPVRVANYLSSRPLYAYEFCSPDGEVILASNGMAQRCEPLPEVLSRDSTIFVLASWGGENYSNRQLISWLRRQNRNGVQICGVEMGAYILAEANLLANLKATTHWSYLRGFREKYPRTTVSEQLYTEIGPVMTCAGGTAGFDLMLSFIGTYRGRELAGEIADQIMHHPLRPATAPQRTTHGRGLEQLPESVRDAVRLIEEKIEDPPRVGEIAERIGISQRQLERRFNASFGCSISQFSQLLRLQHARVLLISTDLSISEITSASGFNTQSHFNKVFKARFGRKPSAYRNAWPEHEPVPHWPGTLWSYIESIRTKPKD
ncbi:GlxA family transcriptional regulator [Aminobacter sp. SR38]|jgi:AraC family carnitine catabolism transcriptional activator|uniref:GlxA family transcriptional regulator n=1 Tax=Aminobacter sp. SR38 TaxID=2774562 RepID=UPI001FEF3126|nr:GlxA family transcriptional regulator [Aminobacter sp. SR38]